MDVDDTEFDFSFDFSVVDDIMPEHGNDWPEVAPNEQVRFWDYYLDGLGYTTS